MDARVKPAHDWLEKPLNLAPMRESGDLGPRPLDFPLSREVCAHSESLAYTETPGALELACAHRCGGIIVSPCPTLPPPHRRPLLLPHRRGGAKADGGSSRAPPFRSWWWRCCGKSRRISAYSRASCF